MTPPGATLRVAHYVETLATGGAENLAVMLAGGLSARGHDARLIFAGGDGPLRSRVAPGVRVHDLGRHRVAGRRETPGHFLGTCRVLAALLRNERIEILQTHLPLANFQGLTMALRGVCRVYPTVHNNLEFDYGEGIRPFRRAARRAAYRAMLQRCAGVIAVSARVKESLVAQLGASAGSAGRIAVVRNGVAPFPVTEAADRERARSAFAVPPGAVLVAGVGRLTAQKDFSALIGALGGMPAGDPAWHCIIAGEGGLRAALEAEVATAGLAGRVRLAGRLDDVPALLAAADVFCLPSRFEGLPLALLEAMSAGLPVVAFAIPGVEEILTDGEHGLLASPGDIPGLGRALATLVCDIEARRRLGAAARERVLAQHGLDAVLDSLESIYRS